MKITSEFNIPSIDAEKLVSAVAEEAVSLLTGAGASYGAEGGDGILLAGGGDLAIELNNAFGLGLVEPDTSNLSLVYGDIKSQKNLHGKLNNFLQKRFVKCIPTWQPLLRDLPWKRIWTLNIDDILERVPPDAKRDKLLKFLWNDNFEPRRLDRRELQLVYLHGKAEDLKLKPDHLIFSIPEYAGRVESTPGWHTEFRSEFCQKPFIICGARLQEEYDLATVLNFGNRSRERGGCPSLVVLRSFAPGQKERFERQGLIAVSADGDKFFNSLLEDVLEWKRVHALKNEKLNRGFLELKAHFRNLSKEKKNLINRRPLNFYECAETQWGHIINNNDAIFEEAKSASVHLSTATDRLATVSLVTGGPTSGKTAAIYRAAALLIDAGYSVWEFRGEEGFNVEILFSYLTQSDKLVLLFDDCANYASIFLELMAEAERLSFKLRVLAACDASRTRGVTADWRGANLLSIKMTPLKRRSFEALFQKRNDKGRLGRCANMSDATAWHEFSKTYSGHILEWLESLENSHPYHDAIVNIFTGATQSIRTDRSLLAVVATAHRFGYSLPYFIFDIFKGEDSQSDIFSEKGSLSQLGHFDNNGVRLRSRAFSEFVWNQLSNSEKYDWSKVAVLSLAPLVVRTSIVRRTLPYQIIKSLMSWETVKANVGERADDWYGELESTCGWNARFWEQRALLASDKNQEFKAYSYAKKAVNLHSTDPFTHTTLGKICVHIGIARKDHIGVERFWEGVTSLETSRNIARDSGLEWEHPYMTFFIHALRAADEVHFQQEFDSLNRAWNDWMAAARSSRAFPQNSVGFYDLEEFVYRWLSIATRKTKGY